jgi:hypothetical protein
MRRFLPTDPESIAAFLYSLKLDIETVGLESGSISHWLTTELQNFGLRALNRL